MSEPPLADLSDADLARRVASGERAAAEALILRHEAVVRAFLRRICFDRSRVDDLAQETFLRLLRYAGNYDPAYPMRTWLLTIARRLSITAGTKPLRLADADSLDNRPCAPAAAPAFEREDHRAHTDKLLDAAMRGLTEPQRTTLVLFYQQGLPIEEIARILEMPSGTVKSHLSRARAGLQERLASHREEFMP